MKDLIQLNDIYETDDCIVIIGVAEDMICVGHQTLEDPPEYAPARVRIEVPKFYFPEDYDFNTSTIHQIKSYIDEEIGLQGFDWEVITGDYEEPRSLQVYF